MLAGTLEMLVVFILDLRSVVDINILTDVNRQRTTRRRRVDHRRSGRGSRDGQDDEQCLMQMPKAKGMKVVDSSQNGEIKENEVPDTVRETTRAIQNEDLLLKQDRVKQHVHAIAMRNSRSTVPAQAQQRSWESWRMK